MKLSLNFLRDYIDLDKNIDLKEFAEKMTSLGHEYDDASKLIKANNLIIGEVIECKDHHDSDHLHICLVNIGKEVLQIVCGAKNVRKGLKVIVALNGAELPGGKITQSVIRGIESNGMICSLAELGIDKKFLNEKEINGISELPESAEIGGNPIEFLKLDDEVVDFDLTANRGDLLSILGMSYEVATIYNQNVKNIDLSYKEYNELGEENIVNNLDIKELIDYNKELDFDLEVNTDKCTMFLARKVTDIKIKESPQYIKARLIASGIRPINNVVDISNYVMLETGQPLHFYDLDKLNNKISVRMANDGEELITLDGQKRNLSIEDIVITDGQKPIGLAGVMGGLDTEITETTKNILIETAIFNNVNIRKTSNRVLRSEASNRFEKRLDPIRTYMASARACKLLEKYAEGKVVQGISKYDIIKKENKKIEITIEKINAVLGTNLNKIEIIKIFKDLGFIVIEKENNLIVEIPTRRIDINIQEDLIEEVGRIYGVDKIEGRQMILPIKKGIYNKPLREIRNKIISLGLNETLTYSLVSDKEANMFTINNSEKIKMLDPLSEERNTLRQSLITSLYKIYQYNKNHFINDIQIFEIGKVFYKEDKYIEENKLACLMTGNYYLGLDKKSVNFYVAKGVVEEILDYLGFNGRYSFIVNDKISKDLHPGQSAIISLNNEEVGIIGKIHPKICKKEVFVIELSLDKILEKKTSKMKYKEISKYPVVNKDLAIIIDKEISAFEIAKTIKNNAGKILKNIEVFDEYKGEGIEEGKKSLAYSLELGDNNKTLTEEEINQTIEKIISGLEKKYNASLRK